METKAPPTIHPFEKAGLGLAPFKCVGVSQKVYQAIPGDPSCPIQPGGSCAYCGQGIMWCAAIKSADGKRFDVGMDCVAKVTDESAHTDLERAMAELGAQMRKAKLKVDHANKDARIARAMAIVDAHRSELAITWHDGPPVKHARTVLEYLEWMLKHSGRAGKIKVARLVEGIAKERGW